MAQVALLVAFVDVGTVEPIPILRASWIRHEAVAALALADVTPLVVDAVRIVVADVRRRGRQCRRN